MARQTKQKQKPNRKSTKRTEKQDTAVAVAPTEPKPRKRRSTALEKPDTPGQRLRLFCQLFFPTITVFAHDIGFQKPGSLYDYFNNKKRPGGMLLDRFRDLGGDPAWLRYGTGSMFANNDMGKQRMEEYRQKFPNEALTAGVYPNGEGSVQTTEPQQSYNIGNEFAAGPLDQSETVYLLLSRTLYRLQSVGTIPAHVLDLYRRLLNDIRTELDRHEPTEQ